MVQTFFDYVGPTGHGCENWWRRSGVFWKGIMQKQGVYFPEMEKRRFGRLEHWKTRMDGLCCTRDQSGLSAPRGKVVCMEGVMGSLWLKTHILCTHTHAHKNPTQPNQPCCDTAKWSRQVSPSWISFQCVCVKVTRPPALAASSSEPPVSEHCQFPQGVTVSFQQASHKSMIKPHWEAAAVFGRL